MIIGIPVAPPKKKANKKRIIAVCSEIRFSNRNIKKATSKKQYQPNCHGDIQ
jgi:hypothetical protein